MRIVSRYIFKQVTLATLVVLLVVFGLDLVFRLANELGQLHNNYDLWHALAFVFLGSPLQFYSVIPMVAMIGCVVGLGTLSDSSELVVMRSAGVSSLRLTWLALRPTLLFLFAAVVVGEFVAPHAEVFAGNMKALAKRNVKQMDLTRTFWLRDKSSFVYVSVVKPDGHLFGVNIFDFDERENLTRVRVAEEAVFREGGWQMAGVDITTFRIRDNQTTSIEHTGRQPSDFWATDVNPALLRIAVSDPRDLTMRDLDRYIDYLEGQSLNAIEYKLAFFEKLFYPLIVLSLILIGISFVFGPLRQATMGYRLFCGIMVGVLVKTLQTAVGPVSIVFGLSPVLAMALPSVICCILGLYMLSRVR